MPTTHKNLNTIEGSVNDIRDAIGAYDPSVTRLTSLPELAEKIQVDKRSTMSSFIFAVVEVGAVPVNPIGGSWDPITNVIVPPDGWSTTTPEDASDNVDVYLSTNIFSSETGEPIYPWTTPIKVSGRVGATGPQGPKGEDATSLVQQRFLSTVFKRSTITPTTPSDGSYASPVPEGWSDGVPEGDEPLYMTTRMFTNDGKTPQSAVWSIPTLVTSTDTTVFMFSTDESSTPGDPTTRPDNWFSPETASTECIWMAIGTSVNAAEPLSWSVVRIKGEGGNTIFTSQVFKRSIEQPETPIGGSFEDPVPEGWSDGIPEGDEPVWMTVARVGLGDVVWSEPTKIHDSSDVDYAFLEASTYELTPGDTPYSPENGWTNEATPYTIWMAMRKVVDGAYEGDWRIVKIKGENGTSFIVKGTKPSVEELPEEASVGDGYIVEGELYVWTGEEWAACGPIKGDKGDKGDTGETGLSAYLHTRYAVDEDTEDIYSYEELLEEPELLAAIKYVGTCASTDPIAPTEHSAYNWVLFVGKDGVDYEFIYAASETEVAPTGWDAITNSKGDLCIEKDFVPDGWSDNAVGVTAELPYEWRCYRKSNLDGSWSQYSIPPVLSGRYGKDGKDGDDGTSIKIKGSYDSYDDFAADWIPAGQHKAPEDPSDCYMVKIEDEGELIGCLFVWDGNRWVNVGRFQGEKGDPGADAVDSHLYIRYASHIPFSISDLKTTPDKYIGFLVTTKLEDELVWADWKDVPFAKFEGEDGFGYEFVYLLSETAPILDETVEDPDGRDRETDWYCPSAGGDIFWENDPLEPAVNKPCWVAQRKKVNNAWMNFSAPAIWTTVADSIQGTRVYYAEKLNTDAPDYSVLTEEALLAAGWVIDDYAEKQKGFTYYTLTVYDYEATSNSILTFVKVPYDGQTGYTIYPAGQYDSTKPYSTGDNSSPYVVDDGLYWYLNPDLSTAHDPIVRPYPGEDDTWMRMDKFDAILTKLLIADNGTLGQFVFSGDYMFSMMGKVWLNDTTVGGRYEDLSYNDLLADTSTSYIVSLDWEGRNEPESTRPDHAWYPNTCINQFTGKILCEDSVINGEINATSGKIGDVIIDSGHLVSNGDYNNYVDIGDGAIMSVGMNGGSLRSTSTMDRGGFTVEERKGGSGGFTSVVQYNAYSITSERSGNPAGGIEFMSDGIKVYWNDNTFVRLDDNGVHLSTNFEGDDPTYISLFNNGEIHYKGDLIKDA